MSSIGSTQAAYRGHRSRLEDAVKEKLIEKVTQEHGDETSRKTNLDTYLEDATRLLDGLMNTLHQHTSALIDEAEVNDALSRTSRLHYSEHYEHGQEHCGRTG